MYGTFSGNLMAIVYFFVFQLCGVVIADCLFKKEKGLIRLLIGSVCGSFFLMWLPVITSFVLGFNLYSHLLALVILLVLMLVIVFKFGRNSEFIFSKDSLVKLSVKSFVKDNLLFILLFLALCVFYFILLYNHVLLSNGDGALYCGQCTYGDMNMHLGFITSIANQGTFPPDYSIMPGEKLCYPFLCDSISSSLYIFGSSLKLAYCLPMAVAFIQVLGGFYAFANQWLKDKAKSVLSFVLFFLNGGLGFLYFLGSSHSISEIFTEFYHTPTNFVDYNIRWVNVIADMLLPQRATLFGWSVLFTVLYILWRAHFEGMRKYFYFAGVLAGGLVMIHTHSFLALGIVCAVWLMFYMTKLAEYSFNFSRKNSILIRGICLFFAIGVMSVLRYIDLNNSDKDLTSLWFICGIAGIAFFVIYLIIIGIKLIKKSRFNEVLKSWGAFLLVVLPLALVQLFTWTFNQAKGDNFVRGQFNWANIDDQYFMFYLKNIGLVMIFIIAALLISEKKHFKLAMCGIAIWFVAEFLGFQPNEYDNNKLLYVGFIFLLIPAASLMLDLYRNIKHKIAAVVLAAVIIFVCTISAILTLGRELVSEYQLYESSYVDLVDYINDSDIPADEIILTGNNHNNAVASLTGRNIFIGSGTFLYYHGFSTYARDTQLKEMYENPAEATEIFESYDIKYVVIGSQEKYSFDIDYQWYSENSYMIFESGDVMLLQLR